MASSTTPTSSVPESSYLPLHSVMRSLQSCLDGLFPDIYQQNSSKFEEHLSSKKPNLSTERNQCKNGLNYTFETIRQHRDWLNRNQQYIQLCKDERQLSSHLTEMKQTLAGLVAQAEFQDGYRRAVKAQRLGSFQLFFHLQQLAKDLSTPSVPIATMQPDESSISLYCDAFVLDISVADGQGTIQSARLTTVVKDQTYHYADRDAEVARITQPLVSGDTSLFKSKIGPLLTRAGLARKFPSEDFEAHETHILKLFQQHCAKHQEWQVQRSVDGVVVSFKDALQVSPFECEVSHTTMFSVSFTEIDNSIGIQVVPATPVLLNVYQAQKLAILMLHGMQYDLTNECILEHGDKAVRELIKWGLNTESLPFRRSSAKWTDHACTNSVFVKDAKNLVTEAHYRTKSQKMPGAMELLRLPLKRAHATYEILDRMLQLLKQALILESVLTSGFTGPKATFGHILEAHEVVDKRQLAVEVDASSSPELHLRVTGVVPKRVLSINLTLQETNKWQMTLQYDTAMSVPETSVLGNGLLEGSHCLPLVVHFVMKKILAEGKLPSPSPASSPQEGLELGASPLPGTGGELPASVLEDPSLQDLNLDVESLEDSSDPTDMLLDADFGL